MPRLRPQCYSRPLSLIAGRLALALVLGLVWLGEGAASEIIKVGMLREGTLTAPIFIAKAKGYFAAEGLDCEVVNFDAALPVTMGVVSGDLDLAVTALSAGFYKLASQGALKIIAGYGREAPTFRAQAFVVAKNAYAAGLTSPMALAGHSVAVSAIGGSTHYSLGLLSAKYGVDIKSVTVLALQSNPNAATAVAGGRADAGVIPGRYVIPSAERGDIKLIAWIGDEVPWQLGGVITSARLLRDRPETISHFLAAYRNGVRAYHDAFTGPGEKRQNGPTAPELLKIIADATGNSVEAVDASIGYLDRDARLDIDDIKRQIAWYKAQNLLSPEAAADAMIAPSTLAASGG
jgi:NitT/TauT family transport system substrate-binding protein